ncbi:Retrovirus-related Pol polyprotein from type-1 retrotransposable element R1 4 [Amphibalanus amphitrite]|uniref:Retrovirus-related Pol polyprotein from type-1 retrotransposable element R1 4 n=1 Tax=Amphibalanus amphitrite TaxID=1232801 RepID=A0A6A4XCZ4_AMPAM|nr:Retrovirus-related Pol polyprotein from type-1 retrotransposable element R1 4 [Amphibalanus amphitrite]KAF0312162.1 Retrovirus-related Pol polyprotein from type-1 retrotransposable element R1 4 [Amphibalanus amphitrite]
MGGRGPGFWSGRSRGIETAVLDPGSLTDPGPAGSLTDPGPADSLTNPGPADSLTNPGPAGSLTDPGPAGSLTDPGPAGSLAETQLLVLSQNAKDAVGCTIKVSGKTVRAGDSLVLLGIEFDRRLQFGAHCRRLRRRVRPRVAHLRRLAGRSWGLDEQALRTVANGYVRGALEHAAAAWLPATAPSHAELIEREMRAAARIVTGCPRSTPTHAVMAEARLAPMEERKKVLAARLLGRALALPPTDPLRRTAEASAPSRLSSVRGWRTLGRQMLAEVEVTAPIEPVLPPRIPPWERGGNVTFCLDVGPLRTGATEGEKIRAATRHLAALPQRATWLWTDGSVEGGVKDGGSGAVVIWSDGEEEDLKTPAGRHCSSYRAEMLALASGLEHLLDNPRDRDIPIVICTDSMASLATLRAGPTAQTSPLGVRIWRAFSRLSREGHRPIHAQWVPSHCGIEGNERADTIAKEAAELPQEDIPVDSRTICRAVARAAREATIKNWPAGWFRSVMGDRLPPRVTGLERSSAVDVHQLRAGHWSGARSYLHRIGRSPSPIPGGCQGCNRDDCRESWCPLCREEPDRPDHVLLRCPALMGTRSRTCYTIHPEPEEVRETAVVAALAAAARGAQSRQATLH